MRKVVTLAVVLAVLPVASVQAADPIKLEIGGYARQFFGRADNKAALALVNVDAQDNVEVDFLGSSKLDNGLTVGVEVDTNGSQGRSRHSTGPNGDGKRSFVSIAGGFGAIELGEQDNVGFLFHNGSPDVGGLGGQDGLWDHWLVVPPGFAEFRQRTYAGDDRSANKILYVSPTLAGVTAGFSYTPSIDTTNVGNITMSGNNADSLACAAGGTPNLFAGPVKATVGPACLNGDLYVVSLSYVHSFDGVAIKADLAGGQANAAGLTFAQGGVNLSYLGVTLGGSALERQAKSTGMTASGLAFPVSEAIAVGKGTSWDAGLSYVIGPYGLSLTYFMGEAAAPISTTGPGLATVIGADRDDVWALGASYTLGPGVALKGTLLDADYKRAAATQPNNAGWAAVSSLWVEF